MKSLEENIIGLSNITLPYRPDFKEESRRKINDQIKKLGKIITYSPKPPKVDKKINIETVNRFNSDTLLSKDIRVFSWNLEAIFFNEKLLSKEYIDEVLALIDDNWRLTYYNGILNSLLGIWECNTTRKKVQSLIRSKVIKTNSEIEKGLIRTNSRLNNQLESSIYFLDQSGANKLAKEVLLGKLDINKITEFIQLPPSLFSSTYFDKVLIHYVDCLFYVENASLRNKDQVNQIMDFIKFRRKRVKVLIISKLILEVNKGHFNEHKSELKSYAFTEIGDPNIETNWMSIHFNEKEQERADEARRMVLYWINQEFIESFFSLIDDASRRLYWLNFFKKKGGYMKDFKMLLDHDHKSDLRKLLNGLRPHISKRISHFSKDCALTFVINGYRFIEFGAYGGGTLNVHKVDSRKEFRIQNVLKRSYIDKGDIYYKQGEIPELVDGMHFSSEGGRLAHRGEKWKSDLDKWLRKIAKV
ncbi:EH signature domain-containing protein [Flammeovirga sp. EKP202]|uniref:EH signature domain-containing protein n=1 Tax=Flammeovirga sp. EKP202 TaxID=2770592 RepID=UPI00165F0AA2|nr:EH signature domain-containing protein [Flammeovirga sp. EKP202]MBD0404010.1 hypothetical protein [Flammeovirga sp. EKP202]